MKQYGNFKLGVLLLASAGLASCSSDDTFSGSKGQSGEPVKTQFAISVPVGKSGRLSQDIVQGQSTPLFRGMQNIKLVPFTGDPTTDGTGSNPISLGLIKSDDLEDGTNAKVYYNVSLNTDVDHFLFYGEAYSANDNALTDGAINANVAATTAGTYFKLVGINVEAVNNAERATLLSALNTLVGTTGWADSQSDLANYYNALTSLKAGSATSVKFALKDLSKGIEAATATNEDELKETVKEACATAVAAVEDLTFPANVGLPDGATQLKWNKNTKQFEWADKAIGDLSADVTTLDKYVYPASLYYRANTTIKTANTPVADQYSGDWNTCLDLYTDGTSVTSKSQSVALVDPVQYAVARLDVTAKFANATVNDNLGEPVNTSDGTGITLNGILVSTYKDADWQLYNNNSLANTGFVIYDPSITPTKVGTTTDLTNPMAQTLTLASNKGESVKFALELVNNTGKAFTGIDGMIPNGAKFYLIGQLDPKSDKANNRVFEQAYNTKANVTINSLSRAYNGIPDLENPKLELGLSVKLEWAEGLVQDVTID